MLGLWTLMNCCFTTMVIFAALYGCFSIVAAIALVISWIGLYIRCRKIEKEMKTEMK